MVASSVLGISLVDQAEDPPSLLRVVAEGAVQASPAVEVPLPQAKGRKGWKPWLSVSSQGRNCLRSGLRR
ncbi:MAG: hypothetical protein DRG33_05865 [Deltaproteobacteria bacterium]|nr:MAG: hypothetical protein DRG33_05865 [Deltaproteobacteria bacterium]